MTAAGDPAAAPRPPAIARLLETPLARALAIDHGRDLTVAALRAAAAAFRAGAAPDAAEARILAGAAAWLARETRGPRRVLNLTGTVLHTNLGRAPLPPEALAAMAEAAAATDLEFDLDGGRRGERDSHAEALLRHLTGAEAALLVNNNAAAVLLLLRRIGGAARGHRLARGTGRDRRRLPHPRHHARGRLPAARGRHHQPHPPPATTPPRSARAPPC